jgi:hypothetical protein
MKRTVCLLALTGVFLLGVACIPSCYTVLKHPRQVSMTDDHGGRRSCSDCHDQAYYYHDPFMYRYYDRYSYWNRWYGYYYDPWWYDDYWYYDSWDGEGPPILEGGRTRWGTDSNRPGPPDRGATTTIETPSGQQPKTTPGGEPSSSSTVEKKDQTRWGNQPARPQPPEKGKEEKSGAEKKPEQKKSEDPEK